MGPILRRHLSSAVVTGCTGCIGQALVRSLLDHSCEVFAVLRPNSERNHTLPNDPKLHQIELELEQISNIPERVSKPISTFFHLGWTNTYGSGRHDMEAQIRNVQYTLEALQASKKMNCKCFVFAGSQAEYGRVQGALRPETPCFPENGYGMAKLCAGQMVRKICEQGELEAIHVRFLSVYGPHDRKETIISSVIRSLIAGKRPALSKGEQVWDFLYSEDAAEALIAAAKNGKNGAVYPLGSGSARPLREYIEILRDKIDPSLPLGFGEIPYDPQQVMHLEADISALETDCGFRPRTSFEEGVQKTINWIKGEL